MDSTGTTTGYMYDAGVDYGSAVTADYSTVRYIGPVAKFVLACTLPTDVYTIPVHVQ